MIQYREVNEQKTSSVVREAQVHYGTRATVTTLSSQNYEPLGYFIEAPVRSLEAASTASINTAMIAVLYHEIWKDVVAKLTEWQRAEQERWEQLEMEMDVEHDTGFEEPHVPVRIIKARVYNMGRAPVPDFLFDSQEE